MYAMVWSALPYFSVCADGSSQVCLILSLTQIPLQVSLT